MGTRRCTLQYVGNGLCMSERAERGPGGSSGGGGGARKCMHCNAWGILMQYTGSKCVVKSDELCGDLVLVLVVHKKVSRTGGARLAYTIMI